MTRDGGKVRIYPVLGDGGLRVAEGTLCCIRPARGGHGRLSTVPDRPCLDFLAASCVDSDDREVDATLAAGTWWVSIDTPDPSGAAGEFLLVVLPE